MPPSGGSACAATILPLPLPLLFAISAQELSRGKMMAENKPTGPLEMGAEMDYPEHEKTYSLFLTFAKFGSLICAALLIAMAFGFFTSAGFFSATVVFILICVGGGFLLR
jgi:hypothetical protein